MLSTLFFGLLPEEEVDCSGNLNCPNCDSWEELQSLDYVTKPMLWCNNCGFRGVINFKDTKEIKINKEKRKDYEEKTNLYHSGKPKLYEIKFYYIKKISNQKLELLNFKGNDLNKNFEDLNKIFNDNKIMDLISDYEDDIENSNIRKRLKRELKETSISLSKFKKSYDDYENSDFKCWLPVNSYNVEEPKIPYPENFSTNHDGINIYLECIDENDKEFKMKYWGD